MSLNLPMAKHISMKLKSCTPITLFCTFIIILGMLVPKSMGTIFPVLSLGLFIYAGNFKETLKHKPLPLLSLFVVTLCFLSLIWSQDVYASLERALKVFGVFLGGNFFFLAIKIGKREHFLFSKQDLKILSLIIGLGCVYLLFELLWGAKIYHLTHIKSLTEDPYSFSYSAFNRAITLLSLSSVPLLLLIFKERLHIWGYGLSAILLFTIFVSESQAIQLGILLFLISFALSKLTRHDFRKVIYPGLACLFLSLPFLFPYIFNQNPEFLLLFLEEGYPMQRLELWNAVSLTVRENFLFGHGIDTIRRHAFDMGNLYFKTAHTPHPHNALLQIWYEFGLFGVFLIIPILLAPFYYLKTVRFSRRVWGYSFYAGILLIACVSYGLWQSWWIGTLFFILGLANLAIEQVERKDAQRDSQRKTPSFSQLH